MKPKIKPRMAWGRFLIRLGEAIRNIAVAVMKPDDLIELTRQRYKRAGTVEEWGSEELVAKGLTPLDKDLLEKVPVKQGRVLVLGSGGGREAIALARTGYEVVGVDYNAELSAKALENAAKHGVKIAFLVQEVSALELPSNSFDLAVLFAGMYSTMPTRRRRVQFLKKIASILKPGGYFACQFLFYPDMNQHLPIILKIFAWLSFGNFWYEPGDRIGISEEFFHVFSSLEELKSEFSEGGFTALYFADSRHNGFLGAVLRLQN
jgi:SAM-dependent methyltransferase